MQELREGLEKQHHRMSSEQVSRLLDTMDLDRDGQVDYGEFVAATVSSSLIIREENLLRAFELFDSDGSGFLTPEEIEAACQKYGISLDDASAQAILEGADANGDGQVGYYEFCAMMRSQEKSLLNMKGRLRSSTSHTSGPTRCRKGRRPRTSSRSSGRWSGMGDDDGDGDCFWLTH